MRQRGCQWGGAKVVANFFVISITPEKVHLPLFSPDLSCMLCEAFEEGGGCFVFDGIGME